MKNYSKIISRNNMKSSNLLVLVLLLCAFTASIAFAGNQQDEEFSEAIVGTWVMHKKNDHSEMYGETNYKDDKSFQSSGYFILNGEKSIIEFSGEWSIVEGVLTEEVIQSNTAEINGQARYKIISVSDDKYMFVSEKTGVVDSMQKK